MALDPATLDAMVAAGFTGEQIATVVKAELMAERARAAASDDARRAKAADKKRRQRAEARLVSPDVPGTDRDTEGQTGTDGDIGGQAGTETAAPAKNGPQTPKETTNQETTPSAPKGASPQGDGGRRRGSRIPSDFAQSAEARQVAAEFGYRGEDADEPLAEFCDFWRGVPGLRGTKLDWPATLRNRFREIGRRNERAGPRAAQRQPSGNGLSHIGDRKAQGDVSVYRDPFAHLDGPRARRAGRADDEGRAGPVEDASGYDEAERGRLLDFDRLRAGSG